MTFSQRNRKRCEAADGFNHTLHSWDLNRWMVATLGELGEAANIIKKLNRVADGVPGNSPNETREVLESILIRGQGWGLFDIPKQKNNSLAPILATILLSICYQTQDSSAQVYFYRF